MGLLYINVTSLLHIRYRLCITYNLTKNKAFQLDPDVIDETKDYYTHFEDLKALIPDEGVSL